MPNPGPAPTARRRATRLAVTLAVLATTLSGCLAVTPPPATQPPQPSVAPLALASVAPTLVPTLVPEATEPPASTVQPTLAPVPTSALTQAPAPTPAPTDTPVPLPTQAPVPTDAPDVGALLASLAPSPSPIPVEPSAGPIEPEPSTLMADSSTLTNRLQAAIDKWRKQAKVPGVVAAMRFPDGSVWSTGSGKAIMGTGAEKATGDTPWVIGSITKTFVAALAFQLQEEGKLSLDQPLSDWYPDWPEADKITLRMLMNHTSGVGDYFWNPKYKDLVYGRPTYHWTVDEILQLAAEQPRVFPPGTNQSYSNTNYILLGRVLEMVGGAPLAQQLRQRFFDPLGLKSVVFQGEEPVPDGAAKGYWWDGHWVDWSDGTTIRPSTSAATVVWAAGAILASASDLLKWETALYTGDVLSPDSLHQLLTFGREGYGPGTRTQKLAGWEGYGHGGSLRGFISGMYRLPGPDVDVVLMVNRGDVTNDPTLLMADLVKIAVGRKPGTGPKKHNNEPSAAPSLPPAP
ncbi:MAG: serine hydrolase [Chloroflexota bacterium]